MNIGPVLLSMIDKNKMENKTKPYAGVLTFFQQLVTGACTTVENLLARTLYPLDQVSPLTQPMSVVARAENSVVLGVG